MSTRGLSTATLEKAAKAKKAEAEQQALAQAGVEDEDEELLPDEHLDELPFDDDSAVDANFQQAQQELKTIEDRVEQTLQDTAAKLAAQRAAFRDTLKKHVQTLESRGLSSSLAEKIRQRSPEAETRVEDMKQKNKREETKTKSKQTADKKRVATAAAAVASPISRSSSNAANPFSSPSSSDQKSQFSQTARSEVPALSFSSPAPSDRPNTARPSSATRRGAVTPRQRLEQAKLFSEHVYGAGDGRKVGGAGQDGVMRDELTGSVLPAALTKVRATSAPYRPQHAKPSFVQPMQPLEPIMTIGGMAPKSGTDRSQKSDSGDDSQRPSSSSSNASQSTEFLVHSSTISTHPTQQQPISKPKSVIKKKPTGVASVPAAPSSSLFSSPFSDLKPVAVMTPSQAKAMVVKKELGLIPASSNKKDHPLPSGPPATPPTTNISTTPSVLASKLVADALADPSATSPKAVGGAARSTEAAEASQRRVAVLAATKVALNAAKFSTDLSIKPDHSKQQLAITKGVQINPPARQPKSKPAAAAAPTSNQPPAIVGPSFAPTVVQQTLHAHNAPVKPVVSAQPGPAISANRPNVLSPKSQAQANQQAVSLTQAQRVRQQLIQAQLAQAKAQVPEEIDLNVATDDDEEGLETLDSAAGVDDSGGLSLFARPWSAHARAEHAAMNSSRSRPASAAKKRPEDHVMEDQAYASFSLPSHENSLLVAHLQGQINVSSAYARAFTQPRATASSLQQQQQQQRRMNHLASEPSIRQTPRGSLPVTQNPFLLRPTASVNE